MMVHLGRPDEALDLLKRAAEHVYNVDSDEPIQKAVAAVGARRMLLAATHDAI